MSRRRNRRRPTLERLAKLINDIPAEEVDRAVGDEHIGELALSLTDWRVMAPFLGVSEIEEREIIRRWPNDRLRQNITMLRKWKNKFVRKATFRKLLRVFWQLEKVDLVQEVYEMLLENMSEDDSDDEDESLDRARYGIIAPYAEYMRGRYQTEIPNFYTLQWPPPLSRKAYTVILAKRALGQQHDNMVARQDADGIACSSVPVKLEDIFRIDSHKRKVIVLEGCPGAGKSSVAWRLCQRWESGRIFRQFKVVVFIQLHEKGVKKAKVHPLSDFIPAESRNSASRVISAFQAMRGKRILFVLDSWDKLAPHLRKQSVFASLIRSPKSLNMPFCSVVVATRPICSADLLPFATSRVEIAGFTPEGVDHFFNESLSGDPKFLGKLEFCMLERPMIQACCYVPLHSAITTHLFLALNRTLPPTLHGLFTSLVLCCIIRHEIKRSLDSRHSSKIATMETLPLPIREPVDNMAALAYYGVMQGKLVFTEDDLKMHKIPANVRLMSVLQGVETYHSMIRMFLYNFVHVSIQELMAAFYISRLPVWEQEKIFKELFLQPHYYDLCLYYAGFSMLRTSGLRDFVTAIIRGGNEDQLLAMLRCVHETQDNSLCQYVVSLLDHKLSLSWRQPNAMDLLAVGYLLTAVCLTMRIEFKACFRLCSLDDYKIRFFLRDLCKVGVQSGAYIYEEPLPDETVIGRLDLDLWGNYIKGEGASQIAELLNERLTLSKLDMSYCEIQEGKDGFLHICQHIDKNLSLTDLALVHCMLKVNEENGQAISKMLQANKTLRSLDLSENEGVTDFGAQCIADGLRKNKGLDTLRLWKCGLTAQGAEHLAKALRVNRRLKSLYIGENDIGDEGVAYLSRVLERNAILTEMYVGSCKITEKGAESLAAIIGISKSLQVLEMSDNEILDTGAARIAEALKSNHSLKTIGLSEGSVTDKGVESLASALLINKSLEKLDLGKNQFTDAGLAQLTKSLQSNQKLKTLMLSELANVTEGGLKQFVLKLRENFHVTHLYVAETAGGHETVQVETKMVNETRRLKDTPFLQVLEYF